MAEYVFNAAATTLTRVVTLDATHFVVAYIHSDTHGYAIVGTVAEDGSVSYGTAYEWLNGASTYLDLAVLDSTHFALTYSNGTHGQAKIGTVSNGNQISYGSEYEFLATQTQANIIEGLDSTHFVISYQDSAVTRNKAIIGTVSGGTQISFGTGVMTANADTSVYQTSSRYIAKIDSTHFVMLYDTYPVGIGSKAIIGTIANGNQISFGTPVAFNAAVIYLSAIKLLDSTHFVLVYSNSNGSYHGQAKIGTIANGNEISFGSDYEFNPGNTYYYASIVTLDSARFVINYSDNGNTQKGTSVLATVSSGNQISFGSDVIFNDAVTTYVNSWLLDSSHYIVAYSDGGNSSYGTAIVVSFTPTPVTFIPKIIFID